MITRKLREDFDHEFETVMAELPGYVRGLLAQLTVMVEDHPSPDVLREMAVEKDELCGLYTGIPITERSVEHVATPSDVIHIYRQGLLAASLDRRNNLDLMELREQIRITLLHELGHYYGFEDDDLDELGY